MRSNTRTCFLVLVLAVGSHALVHPTLSSEEKQEIDKAWIKYEQVFKRGDPVNVNVSCGGDAPVHHCQFSWYDKGGSPPAGPLSSLSLHNDDDDDDIVGGTHANTGLNFTARIGGDVCHLTLEYERFQDAVVGCRVRGDTGDWKYATIDLYSNEFGLLRSDANQARKVVLPGGEVTLLCHTKAVVTSCRLSTPSSFEEAVAEDSAERYTYYVECPECQECRECLKCPECRQCLECRECSECLKCPECQKCRDCLKCGLTVRNVTERDEGRYTCLATEEFTMVRVERTLEVVVARPPSSSPVVQLEQVTSSTGRTTLRATCAYGISRPEADVTWYLDEDEMTSHRDAAPPDYWRWPAGEAGRDNSSSVLIGPEGRGRRLKCVVQHVALEVALESEAVEIERDYPPVETRFTINHEKGITLKATCKTGPSRPVANITWLLGDRIVRQDDTHDGVGRRRDGDDDVTAHSISQTLYAKLRPQDDGKMLRCVVTHQKLARPVERAERVWYKPFDQLSSIVGEEVVVLPGKDANLACVSLAVDQKYLPRIDTCSFHLFGRDETAHFHRSDQPRHVAAGYRFHGGPVELGGCGIVLERVTEADNGRVLCRIESDKAVLFRRYMTVVVAHPPSAPVLSVEYDGPVLKARCSVGPSRPVARLTWVLGDDIIRRDSEDDSSDGVADKTDACGSPLVEAAITQTLAWRLEPEDNGKLLRCEMSHPSLVRPIDDSHEILF